jgi:hypothetical protein
VTVLVIFSCEEKVKHRERFEQIVNNNDEGSRMMKDSIKKIIDQIAFKDNPFESLRRLEIRQRELDKAMAEGTDYIDVGQYGKDLLEAGKNSDALDVLGAIIQNDPNFTEVTPVTKEIYELYGVALVRAAFEDNSNKMLPEDWLIFPVPPNGKYVATDNLNKAKGIYRKILQKFPDDALSKWLYNLCYYWEGKLAPDFRIDPKEWGRFDGRQRFNNLAMYTGTGDAQRGGGVVLDDFTGNGLIDIMVSSGGLEDVLHLYENKGNGQFEEITKKAGLSGIPGGNALIQADYDNDGDLDVLVIRSGWKPYSKWGILPNSLLRNEGDGRFVDMTIDAGLYDVAPTGSACWWDFNNDGWLDLFVANETVDREEVWKCKFYLNEKNGTFKDITDSSNLRIVSNVKSVISGDLNNDGLMDLYLSVHGGKNKFIANASGDSYADWRFAEFAVDLDVVLPHFANAATFTDFNNDGWADLCVQSFDFYGSTKLRGLFGMELSGKSLHDFEAMRMYANSTRGTYSDVTEELGLAIPLAAQGFNFGDIDNDGWEDLYIGTGTQDMRTYEPNRLFKNIEGQRFEDWTSQTGLGILANTSAVAFADLDNDGDQDIYAVVGGMLYGDRAPNALFENPLNNNNHWITLRLEGVTCNRSAIGARVKIVLELEDGSERIIHRTVSSGSGFGSNSLQLEVGLGNALSISDIEIIWPNGKNQPQSIGPVRMDQILKIVENQVDIYPQKLPAFKINRVPNEMMNQPEKQQELLR